MRPLVLVCSVLVFVSGCFSDTVVKSTNVSAKQKAKAEQVMGISFPPSTELLLFAHRSGLEDAVWLKVALPPEDANQLLRHPLFHAAEWKTDWRAVDDVPDWSEWAPSKVSRFRSAELALPDVEFLSVLIDETSQSRKVIYLMWYQT